MVPTVRSPAASTTVRITLPFAAQGVGMERLSRCATGILASIWLSVSLVLATSPSSRANAAIPSMERENSGSTKPPRPSAAKMTSSAAVASYRPCSDIGVQSTWTPWKRDTRPATRVVVTGSATRPLRRSAAIRSSTTSSARSSLTRAPLSSTRVIRSPTGSNRTPKPATGSATPRPAGY